MLFRLIPLVKTYLVKINFYRLNKLHKLYLCSVIKAVLKEIAMSKMSPIKSIINTIKNFILGKLKFGKKYNGKTVIMDSGKRYKIFRHLIINTKEKLSADKCVFIVEFKLKNMSVAANRIFSILPIAMFVGLPGFKEKFWMCNQETGLNQGVYQWATYKNAEDYSKSFAVNFMTKRSIPGSIKFKIIPNEDIMNCVDIQ